MNRRKRKARAERRLQAIQAREAARWIDLAGYTRDLQEAAAKATAERLKAEAEAPVFSEAVCGYRAWRIDAFGDLRPLTCSSHAWQPGTNEATCAADTFSSFSRSGLWSTTPFAEIPREQHASPATGCHCGLYGWNDAGRYLDGVGSAPVPGMPIVAGSISAWGQMRVHHDGFRAQYACVTSLVIPKGCDAPLTELIERVAERFRVAAVSPGEMEIEASKHGTPLPDWMRPPKPPSEMERYRALLGSHIALSAGPIWTTTTTANSRPFGTGGSVAKY